MAARYLTIQACTDCPFFIEGEPGQHGWCSDTKGNIKGDGSMIPEWCMLEQARPDSTKEGERQ